MSDEEKEFDVFLSYNSADEDITRKVAERLEREKIGERQIRVFFAPWEIKPGDNFLNKLDEGLAKARYFAPVLSPESLKAEWPTAERSAALLKDPSGRLGRVIPIRVKTCKIPPLLAFRNYINIEEPSSFESEIIRLICTIKGIPLPRGTDQVPGKSLIAESGPSTLIQSTYSSDPDFIAELIHSNLYEVTKIPPLIWIAPTTIWSKDVVYQRLRGKDIPPFILREKHLFTFSPLTDAKNPLRDVVDTNNIETVNVEQWFTDEDYSRWLIDLLSSITREFCRNMGLFFDNKGKLFYADKKKVADRRFSWTAHVRTSTRSLIIPYIRKDPKNGEGRTLYYRHRAVSLRFIILGKKLFLRIEPGWEFTIDGSVLIRGRKRSVLNTKLTSKIRNLTELDEMRFWAWLLSDGKQIVMGTGGEQIGINSKSLAFQTYFGRHGDRKIIPDLVTEPPPLTEDFDVDEIGFEDMEDTQEEEKEDDFQ